MSAAATRTSARRSGEVAAHSCRCSARCAIASSTSLGAGLGGRRDHLVRPGGIGAVEGLARSGPDPLTCDEVALESGHVSAPSRASKRSRSGSVSRSVGTWSPMFTSSRAAHGLLVVDGEDRGHRSFADEEGREARVDVASHDHLITGVGLAHPWMFTPNWSDQYQWGSALVTSATEHRLGGDRGPLLARVVEVLDPDAAVDLRWFPGWPRRRPPTRRACWCGRAASTRTPFSQAMPEALRHRGRWARCPRRPRHGRRRPRRRRWCPRPRRRRSSRTRR